MRRHWEQLRGALTRRIRYKVTRGGLLFTLAILVVGLPNLSPEATAQFHEAGQAVNRAIEQLYANQKKKG